MMRDPVSGHGPVYAQETVAEAEEEASIEPAPEPEADPAPSLADDLPEEKGPRSKFHG
jgi:hypothetical protein